MKKIKAVALFSTAILAAASTGVYADELISDGTTSPSTEQVTPSTDTSSEVVIPDDGSTTPSTDTGSTTEPTVPVDPTTPSTGDNTGDNSSTNPGTSEDEPSNSGSETTEPEIPTETEKPSTEESGEVEVPTTDGGKATVVPDTSVPTNNPNITAETAQNAGASQVGTTSTVTGQVVQDVTSDSPVYTNTGATIVSTQNGSVVLADGTITTPEAIGATTNSDRTILVTTATGESATLPMTGDTSTVGLSLLGSVLAGLAGLFFKKRQRFNSNQIN